MYTLEYKDGVCIYKDTMLGIELRLPEALLLQRYSGKEVCCLPETTCVNAVPNGAVRIFTGGAD